MRYVLILLMLWACTVSAYAQTDSAQASGNKTTFTLGAVYANNANYYGQKAEEKMPYVAASAALRFRSGIYFTGVAYRLLNDSGAVVSAGSAGAGIAFNLSKKLVADLSYNYTFYPAHSPFLQAASPHSAGASLQYEYWMTTGLNLDYNFGKQQDAFVTLSTEKMISLFSLAKGKDLVTLTPAIDVTAGTQHFYETYITEKRWRDSLLGVPLPPVLNLPGSTETATRETSRFSMLSYNLRVPLAYNRAHYMIEAAYQLSVLDKNAESAGGTANSFFNLSVYYQF
ncbi:hypothetical protein [Chitinophaga alhagiae]|nr:hypothetical protein [Chitinophaga alhagiae]